MHAVVTVRRTGWRVYWMMPGGDVSKGMQLFRTPESEGVNVRREGEMILT